MLRQLRKDWERIQRGRPGRRFQDYHDGDQRSRGALAPSRLLAIGAGIVVVACGVFLLVAPGPGWALIFLGVALLGTAWRPAARLLDWSEPRLRRGASWVKQTWNRLSAASKVGIGTLAGLVTAIFCYMAVMLVL